MTVEFNETKIYTCSKCGAKYYSNEWTGECDCPNAFWNIFGLTEEQAEWIISAFQETEKLRTEYNPLNVFAYPPNRGRRRGDEIRFWGVGYNIITKNIRHIPINMACIRMSTSSDARSQFSRSDIVDICDGGSNMKIGGK